METLEISGHTGQSMLLIGEKLQSLVRYVPAPNAVIITDHNVWNVYHSEFPPWKVIKIGTGESIKTLDTVEYIYDELLTMDAERSTFLVGIGGGIVCDIAGFVASTYMRGIRFGFVATTLLSQADASVGGKNGVNLKGYKNIVGVFNQPEFVICDTVLLKTLPEKEIRCGFGEVVKHAALGDADLFTYIENNYDKALRLDTKVIERLVRDSIILKSSIVNQDETEKGIRRKLNLGHTFGHAIEKNTGLSHGEAISVGMVIAARLSEKRGLLRKEDVKRMENLLKKLNLPTNVPVDKAAVMDALRKDKKRGGDWIHFVLLDGIGNTIVEKITVRELELEAMDFLEAG
jgi:3-dehydroquinate synthase